jgi:hypothetical protein
MNDIDEEFDLSTEVLTEVNHIAVAELLLIVLLPMSLGT